MLNKLVTYSKEIVGTYFPNEDTKKELLGEIFNEISETLLSSIISLEGGKFPEENCRLMNELTNSVLNQTNHCRDDKYIIKLRKMLGDCCSLKNKYNKNEIPIILYELRKTSMEFKALSMAVNL
jgi:hypothetical protein